MCRRLNANPATAEIKVIQITGAWLSDDARRDGMASGASAYATEPVDEVTLLRESGRAVGSAVIDGLDELTN